MGREAANETFEALIFQSITEISTEHTMYKTHIIYIYHTSYIYLRYIISYIYLISHIFVSYMFYFQLDLQFILLPIRSPRFLQGHHCHGARGRGHMFHKRRGDPHEPGT